MRTYLQEILRWIAVVGFAGYGAWNLFTGVYCVAKHYDGSWFGTLLCLGIDIIISVPFLAVAYICLRRQYRKLFLVLGVIGSVAIFGELTLLPEQLDMYKSMDRHMRENRDFAILGLPFAFLLFFGPIYATAWFFRLCHRLAYPVPGCATRRKRPKTQSTVWLVWLGALLCVIPTLVTMVITFNYIHRRPPTPVPSDVMHNLILWNTGLGTLGALLLFLGLVIRRPIPEQADETSPPNTV
jgi:hypothetical protein